MNSTRPKVSCLTGLVEADAADRAAHAFHFKLTQYLAPQCADLSNSMSMTIRRKKLRDSTHHVILLFVGQLRING